MGRPIGIVSMMVLSMCATNGMAESQRFDYRQTTLPNGLRVVTLEDFACPVVAVHVWYQVGAADEDPERQGFAHLFEHMMFRGTDRLGPKDHFELIHRCGGDANGYTSFDQTVYTNRVPANQLPLALWLEAERMALLRIDADGFATERKVVEEERRLGLNRPYGTIYEQILPAVFDRHPYRWTPIGQIPHLRAASVEEVRAFWQRYYVPNNATLVIVGAVRHEEALRLAREYLGWIPRRPDPPKLAAAGPVTQPAGAGPRELTIAEPTGPVPMVGLAWPAAPVGHSDRVGLQYLALVLGDGRSSRLHLDLVRRQKLAVDVDANSAAWRLAGMFFVRATLSPGGDKAATLAELKRHVQRLIDEPISQAEWTKAHNQLLRAEVTRGMTVTGKAGQLGQYAVLVGQLERVNSRLDEIRAVTPEHAQQLARKYLSLDRATAILVEPTGKGAVGEDRAALTTQPADPTAASIPPPRRPDDFPHAPPLAPLLEQVPQIAHRDKVLANGLKVVVVPDRRAPFVRMWLGLKFGAWSEDPARPGAAAMAARMITRGAAGRTAEQLADELELHAISLDASASLDVAEVHAGCLTEQVERAGRLMADVVLQPTFPPSEFELLRDQALNGLLVKSRTPDYLADRQFRTRLFGDHPYARTATGEPEDLRRLKVADLEGWWKSYVRPDAAVLYLAGDIEPERAFDLADKWLGGWKAAGPLPQPKLPDIPGAAATHIYLVDRPGLVQSEIRIGHVSITRSHPDYFSSRVLGHLFGGSFNSRLNQSLRIEKGLTYGVGGNFVPERFAGTFRVRTFTKTPRTAEAVAVLLEQIKLLRSGEPAAEEMDVSRSYLVGSFAGARETPQATVSDLWLIEHCGLPADYLSRYLAGIRSADGPALARVARERIDPDRLIIVVVGDAAAIKADLEKIAPVTVVASPAASPG